MMAAAAEVTSSSLLLDVLNFTGPLSNIALFLTGVPLCLRFRRDRSTADASSLPFVAGFAMCVVWFRYGGVIGEPAMVVVNAVGACLLASYSACFYRYTARRLAVLRQMVFAVGFVVSLLLAMNRIKENASDADDALETERMTIGFVGSALSVAFAASPLASLGHVFKTGSADSLPFSMILMTCLVTAQWWLFGVLIDDAFVVYPNMIGCLLSGFQLSLFLAFPRKRMLGAKKMGLLDQEMLP